MPPAVHAPRSRDGRVHGAAGAGRRDAPVGDVLRRGSLDSELFELVHARLVEVAVRERIGHRAVAAGCERSAAESGGRRDRRQDHVDRHALDLLEHLAEDEVVRRRVVEGPGRFERQAREHEVDDLVGRPHSRGIGDDVIEQESGVRVVGDARRHPEQLLHRDVRDVGIRGGEVGQHVGDRVVEGERAGLDELEGAGRGERLRDAADARVVVDGRVRSAPLRLAIRGDVLTVLGVPDADPDAGEIVRMLSEHVVEALVDGGGELGVHRRRVALDAGELHGLGCDSGRRRCRRRGGGRRVVTTRGDEQSDRDEEGARAEPHPRSLASPGAGRSWES